MIILELPWTAPLITQNSQGMHYMKRARLVREIRDTVGWLARAQRLPKDCKKIHVRLHWQPAVRRTRDVENVMPMQKHIIDGLALGKGKVKGYGMVPDDSDEYVTWEPPIIHPPVKQDPRMWVEIEVLQP